MFSDPWERGLAHASVLRRSPTRRPQLRRFFDLVGSLLDVSRNGLPPGAFTRGGKLSPQLLVTLLLYMIGDASRRGYAQLLATFWDEAKSFHLELPSDEPVSGPALCTARRKLPAGTIRTLLQQAADKFDGTFGAGLRWHGRRVFAVDGTKVNLHRGKELVSAFGVPSGAYCPQVLVSTLFDVIAKVPHDIVVGPYDSAEREQLVQLLDRVRPGDVVVLDRGYPSFEILAILMDSGIDFVVRVPAENSFKAVGEFLRSGGDDYRILVDPPRDNPMRDRGQIEVRALRIMVPGSEPTVLLTSLRRSEFSPSALRDLYHRRWEIEEFYKLTKGDYLGQGQFHALYADGVRQEINAVALFVAITRYLMAAAAREHGVPYESISPKSGVLGLATYIVRLLLACEIDAVESALARLLDRIVRVPATQRPGRHYRRRSLKPARKWGPGGRHGG